MSRWKTNISSNSMMMDHICDTHLEFARWVVKECMYGTKDMRSFIKVLYGCEENATLTNTCWNWIIKTVPEQVDGDRKHKWAPHMKELMRNRGKYKTRNHIYNSFNCNNMCRTKAIKIIFFLFDFHISSCTFLCFPISG